MNHDWQQWMDKIGDPNVTEQELLEFQQALKESDANVGDYMDTLLAETALELQGGTLVAHRSEETSPPASSVSKTSTRSLLPWGIAAAAVVALSVVGYKLSQKTLISPIASQDHVATITDTNKDADAAGFRIGEPLNARAIEIPDGAKLGIAMRGGARLNINGPAVFRIDGPERVFLFKGRIQTYAPEYAHGFVIDTDDGKITDLGTRFVTANGTEAGTEVHVIEGLVKAKAGSSAKDIFIGGEQAAILKNGAMIDTDYLARRLSVPIDPNLTDSDEDGFADIVEDHYRTNKKDARSAPDALRVSESFAHYPAATVARAAYQGTGKINQWLGGGVFLTEGLSYENNGKKLITKAGCLETTGENGVGAYIVPDSKELPEDGIIYISFLMQQPKKQLEKPFSGLLLYLDEYKEQLFTGELSVADSYGARYAESAQEDPFAIQTDDKPHLFVIRIDQTRFLTDVFIDPDLSKPEADARAQKRYQNAPKFERIALRSGSDSG
ncbi:MAG: FecR domain-containing protein, partial [Akkermansiaceae bacterium]